MSEADPMRWMWRGIIGATLVIGWFFILWHNKFHLTVPVVMIALGYLAVVLAIATLWRVGASAVDPLDEGDSFARPVGPRVDLEKEKKTLLKAIKEAEFDHAMGKLSKADADDLIRMYRARAIEIIKELDAMDSGAAAGPREKIRREVQARLAVDKQQATKKDKRAADKDAQKATKTKADDKKKVEDAKKADEAKADEKVAAKADEKVAAKADEAKADEAKADEAKADEKVAAKADEKVAAKADEKVAAKADEKVDAKAAEAKADEKVDDKAAEAKADEKVDDKADDKADDKVDAKAAKSKADEKIQAKADEKVADSSEAKPGKPATEPDAASAADAANADDKPAKEATS